MCGLDFQAVQNQHETVYFRESNLSKTFAIPDKLSPSAEPPVPDQYFGRFLKAVLENTKQPREQLTEGSSCTDKQAVIRLNKATE